MEKREGQRIRHVGVSLLSPVTWVMCYHSPKGPNIVGFRLPSYPGDLHKCSLEPTPVGVRMLSDILVTLLVRDPGRIYTDPRTPEEWKG